MTNKRVYRPDSMHYSSKIEEDIVPMEPFENSYVMGLQNDLALRVFVNNIGSYTWKLIKSHAVEVAEGIASTVDNSFTCTKIKRHPHINNWISEEEWESLYVSYIELHMREMIEVLEIEGYIK